MQFNLMMIHSHYRIANSRGEKMKKVWNKPELEVLNVNMTMAGPGHKIPDAVQPDPDDPVKYS
jgi:hypothetical protein